MNPKVFDVICCPSCKNKLIHDATKLLCPLCCVTYEIENGVPIMMVSEVPRMTDSVRKKWVAKNPLVKALRKLYHIASSYPGKSYKTKKSRNRLMELVRERRGDEYVLNIGSGTTKYRDDIINLDIQAFENVNLVGNACHLPILSESIDLVTIQGVIQYLWEPEQAVSEMYRILKKGGEVYCELPFLQGLTCPTDFQRYTISGAEKLFKDFKMIEKGVIVGPSSALTWMLRVYFPLLFSLGNQYLYLFWDPIFGWLTTPIKYLDCFLEQKELSKLIASGFFYHGQKV